MQFHRPPVHDTFDVLVSMLNPPSDHIHKVEIVDDTYDDNGTQVNMRCTECNEWLGIACQ